MKKDDFSEYLGKDERVLNAIDMQDETVWKKGDRVSAEYKSRMTMVVTNKRLFSLNKKKLSMLEIRHEDIVTTGWEYHPVWGELVKAGISLVIAGVVFASTGIVSSYIYNTFADFQAVGFFTERNIMIFIGLIGLFFLLMTAIYVFNYFYRKRSTLLLSARDGKEYRFLLRGTSSEIDAFRLSVQKAKDLFLEEKEMRYFNNMNKVMINQVNYRKALEQQEREKPARGERVNYMPDSNDPALGGGNDRDRLPGKEQPFLDGRARDQIANPERRRIGAPEYDDDPYDDDQDDDRYY